MDARADPMLGPVRLHHAHAEGGRVRGRQGRNVVGDDPVGVVLVAVIGIREHFIDASPGGNQAG